METKGSRKNPYTMSEYNNKLSMNQWYGGWVWNGEDLIYHSQSPLLSYSGLCERSNPVPIGIYSEMQQLDIWIGGWVGSSPDVSYYSASGTQYDSYLGNTNNDPWPWAIYDEMLSNGIWEGGWVQDDNELPRYMQNFPLTFDLGNGCGCCGDSGSSGSGSGSGSSNSGCDGSGSGSGSGSDSGGGNEPGGEAQGCSISAGNYNAGTITLVIHSFVYIGELYINWTAGNTIGQNGLSNVSISIRLYDSVVHFQDNNMYAIWEDAYELSIHGSFTVICGLEEYRYILNGGSFTIPGEYHQ